jgi:serine/threonine protein phosphatase PrpC
VFGFAESVGPERCRLDAGTWRDIRRRCANRPDRDALTSYVGTSGLVEVDAGAQALTLAAGGFVVLCTDGLFRALGPDDIAAAIDSAADGQAACDALIRQALGRNLPHQDNVTVLCVKIGQA